MVTCKKHIMALTAIEFSPTKIGILAISAFVTWYIITAVAAWHRLRHIPGPILASFSYLWLGSVAQSASLYYVYRDLCKRYGPLVRVGPNELTTDDPEIMRKMPAARSQYGRDSWYTGARLNPYHDNIFTTMDRNAHSEKKTKIVGGFAGREAPMIEAGVDAQVKSLIEVIRNQYLWDIKSNQGELLEFAALTSFFTMDVISKVAFGEEFGYLKANADIFDFLRESRDNWPRLAMAVDVPWIRNVIFSKLFLKLLGPKESDAKGMGRCMG